MRAIYSLSSLLVAKTPCSVPFERPGMETNIVAFDARSRALSSKVVVCTVMLSCRGQSDHGPVRQRTSSFLHSFGFSVSTLAYGFRGSFLYSSAAESPEISKLRLASGEGQKG